MVKNQMKSYVRRYVVGDPGVKIDTKSLKVEFHIWLDLEEVFCFQILASKQVSQGGFYYILLVQNSGGDNCYIFWVCGLSSDFFDPVFL